MTRIISTDGGGIRGVIPLAVLERLGRSYRADLLAGTSTGAIVACGLAAGLSPCKLIEFYMQHGKAIFSASIGRRLNPTNAKYSGQELRKALYGVFGDRALGDLNKRVLVVGFRLDGFDSYSGTRGWGPKVWNSWQDSAARVVDVLMASTAAPTYFPMAGEYIDGGVCANNPAMCAVTEAMARGNARVSDIEVLSLGTGRYPRYVDRHGGDYGQVAWLRRGLIDIILDGGVQIPEYQCSALLGRRHVRVQPIIPDTLSEMDEPKNISGLLNVASALDLDAAAEMMTRWAE